MGRWVTVISRTRIVQAKAGKPWEWLKPQASSVPGADVGDCAGGAPQRSAAATSTCWTDSLLGTPQHQC